MKSYIRPIVTKLEEESIMRKIRKSKAKAKPLLQLSFEGKHIWICPYCCTQLGGGWKDDA